MNPTLLYLQQGLTEKIFGWPRSPPSSMEALILLLSSLPELLLPCVSCYSEKSIICEQLFQRQREKLAAQITSSRSPCAVGVNKQHCGIPLLGKRLEIATYTAACIFNEDFLPVLQSYGGVGCLGRSNSAEIVDNVQILREEKTAEAKFKEARTLGRVLKAAENDNFEKMEGLFYAPGTAE
ncbi:hypothetical protein TNCT_363661 [Trichonephila clavata]|uniref:Uncharacterized protein n=1 Tax=Trichonephila clavata TaxID=2740835 RepID=A0A8X6F4J0_TRICU|nr:hypothetical protein TNCT_363661 [Trichonephila clavata]